MAYSTGKQVSFIPILILIVLTSQVNCGSFFRLQRKLSQQANDGTFDDDFMINDVQQWVSKTIDKFSHQVEFLGNEIERAVNQRTFFEHDKFFSDGTVGSKDISELQRETPPYLVICASADGYEARHYFKALWIITFSEPGEDYATAKVKCHAKIKDYILGNNEREVKIHMTSPWLSQVITSSENGDEREQYAFLFFLPAAFQDDPPPPMDPTIFFQYMSPRVFAFSFGYGVGYDAGRDLQQEVIETLMHNDETFITSQYYISDYEAPFSENSQNNEMFIPLDDSRVIEPHCGVTIQPTIPPIRPDVHVLDSVYDERSNDINVVDNFEVTDVIYPRAVVTQTALYIHTEVMGCSPDTVDAAIIDLYLNIRMSFSEDILNEIPWDILLLVSGSQNNEVSSTTCSDSRPIELFFKVPDKFRELPLPEVLMNTTSIRTLPTVVNYVTNFDMSGTDATLLDTAIATYSKLKQSIKEAGLCINDTNFFVHSNLQSTSTYVNQIRIPYSNTCWNEKQSKSTQSPSLSTSLPLSSGGDEGEDGDSSGDTFILSDVYQQHGDEDEPVASSGDNIDRFI